MTSNGDSSFGEKPVPSPDNSVTLAATYGLQHLAEISDEMLDSSLVSKLPVDWARAHSLLPVRIDGELCVLTASPSNIAAQESLCLLLDEELRPVVAPIEVILKGIERCYFKRQDSPEEFIKDMSAPDETGKLSGNVRSEDLLQIAGEAPVTRLINLILLEAMKARTSDIHFEPFESRLRVRYRIDGTLYEQSSSPKHMELALVSRLKVMAHMDIAEKRLPQDGMARVRVGEREVDIRVSTVPVAEGERVVLRLLDRASALLPMSSLGMPPKVMEDFAGLLTQTYGLVLVTGPTGSGKTTTLYAAICQLDRDSLNIMTIEDPIEYQIPGIGQIQVKPKIGLTFASGLRHVLRQDPDVILVGETRDAETAETAARSSLTGHLVFSTLHTNDAASAMVRMTDIGVEPYLLAASLRGVLAQRLLRRLCTHCRVPTTPTSQELKALGEHAAALEDRPVWKAKGCPECLGGYKGRTGIYELIVVDPVIQEYIRLGKSSVGEMRRLARESGMNDLLGDAISKALDGATSLSEILHVLGHSGSGAA
ncbi:MAG: GspE/PulE family protein [bacterium]